MNVGLIGGAGFIGTWLEEELLSRGHGVWLAGRRPRFGRLAYYQIDAERQWRRPQWGPQPHRRPEHVIVNLIRPDSIRSAFLSSLCIRHWGWPVIQVSSTAVYGPGWIRKDRRPFPRSRYGWAKLVQDSILPGCVVRLPHVWGKERLPAVVLDRWLIQARRGESPTVYDGNLWLDFVHVRDVARLLADLVEDTPRPGCILVGTGGGAYQLFDLAARIAVARGVPVVFTGSSSSRDSGQWVVPSEWVWERGVPRSVEEICPWLETGELRS